MAERISRELKVDISEVGMTVGLVEAKSENAISAYLAGQEDEPW
jgi:hypothetical protein